jgi:hypothetical protein
MPLLSYVEKKIREIEGFSVTIRHSDGRNMRSDRDGIPTYPYERGARNDWTVATWKQQRFYPTYPGFEVDVQDSSGQPVHGNTLVGTLRLDT